MNNQDKTVPIPDDRQVSVTQVNAAFKYLDAPKTHQKGRATYLCIGSGHKTRKFINERLKYQLPAIPLLADNKNLREQMKSRQKSPLFKVVAGAIAFKVQEVKHEVKNALKMERQSYPILYRLELPLEGERTNFPLTLKEYSGIIEE